MSSIIKNCNRGGIPCMKSTGAVVVDSTLTVSFPIYTNFPKGFSGQMFINIDQEFTATGIANVMLDIQGRMIELTLPNHKPVTSTQITGPGIYTIFMDYSTNTIQLL